METIMNSIDSSQVIDLQIKQIDILLVDNDLASYYLVSEILCEYRINVIHARCGLQGINIFKSTPTISIVLTELLLPNLDGFYILREVKKNKPNVPVIAQTAHVVNNIKQECLIAGFDEFIDKPINIESFTEQIKKLLR